MKFSLNFLKQFVEIKVSAKELADKFTSAGLEIENLKKISEDWVFDAEVTTNRYDWLSILGIAQEAAAVLGKNIKINYPKIKIKPGLTEISISAEDKKDCPYYLARVIEGIKVAPSPDWLKKLVVNCGMASVNNIVDITNYCMLKWGNPLHAFDKDKIEGDICIRRAKDKEEFVGIDQKRRVLSKENLIIADSKKTIALAGVIGAKNTEVTSSTENIFLEAAKFSPITVRRSRRHLGLDTESSYRFERRVSEFFLDYASQEAADLIEELAKGKFSGFKKIGKKTEKQPKDITIGLAKMKNYLGTDFKINKVKKILKTLNFKIQKSTTDKIKVKPALSRFDIEKEVDVYEEFARIYGYGRIKAKIPFLKKSQKDFSLLGREEKFWEFKNKIRSFVSLSGFSEIITYSIESKEELSLFTEESGLELKNPLRRQEDSLRPVLSLGMIKVVKHNLNRGKSNLNIFEIADVYQKNKNSLKEKPFLSLGISGEKTRFFLLKGQVLAILNYLNIKSVQFKESKKKSFSNALEVVVKGEVVGFLGKINKKEKEKFGLKEDLFISELDLRLLEKYKRDKKFKPFSRFPAVWRDISLAIEEKIKFKEVRRIIEKEGQYLADLAVIDSYQSQELPPGYFAFTLRIFYQSKQKTLNSNEVDSYHNNIRKKLDKKTGIILR
ncbi:MAG: phenylalanine--tRNA ligase subunit beta [Candidatus Omnitrophica bacterium]|nr:phenylalanine--tRNA ligase subunit beta [Candidatus Omnitrophota bacterium]MCF7877426.1 phenylalanine--tRNA ligase subunit beta [Candidatus Omnitrophota bacterium]MCF7878618.1 phenylalanine--tRNA ligase subunit beta [Candidatus Omnitrophota bacterium]MCF7892636.1 phenylalanine--tRNA ligase subunit beta [Candidatus Omnitrophota bacterium]